MAMTTMCPDCDNEVSARAAFCPKCGYVFRELPIKLDRKGWATTIALGAVMAYILLFLTSVTVLFFLGFFSRFLR
jgi:uncharacterized paraquat-inducible protein A